MFLKTTSLFIISVALISICVFNCYAFDAEKDVMFHIHTRDNNNTQSLATLFKKNRPTRIFVHGFRSSRLILDRYKEAYLNLGDFNFIIVDWMKGARTFNYLLAKRRVGSVAKQLARFIDLLVENGMNLKDVTMIGHSLGAHVAGRAARQLNSTDKIACIVGLDPAGVGFDISKVDRRLSKSDADYVQIIHTDGDNCGIMKPFGHADMYPNGGKQQPGCPKLRFGIFSLLQKCSHIRAHNLFLDSLTTNFTATQCASYEEIQKGECIPSTNATARMGGDIRSDMRHPHGIFYLETNPLPPYIIPC